MTISNISISLPQITNTNFKGKYKKTEQGNEYYHTDSGKKFACAMSSIPILELIWFGIHKKSYTKFFKMFEKFRGTVPKNFSEAIGESLMDITLWFIVGALFDCYKNNKARKKADKKQA